MSNEMIEMETEEVKEEYIDGSLALTAVSRAEIDVQINTAKMYPRSVKRFKTDALELATLDRETAEACTYALPRGGKPITGPSVRMAEIIQHCWGNIRAEADTVAIDDKYVTAMGSCIDLEKNTASRIRVKRRITTKEGKRFSDDMIAVTANAACSIALREAVFRVVPRALWKDVWDAARRTARGDEKTLKDRRDAALKFLETKHGIKKEKVFARLGKKGVEDIGLDDLELLIGIVNSIKDGEISAAEAFDTEAPKPGQSAESAELDGILSGKGDNGNA
jgi:hypothetical protein